MKTAIIINKDSGSYYENPDLIQDLLNDAFVNQARDTADLDFHVVEGQEIEKRIMELAHSDIDALVACGGDGTVSTAARYLTGTGKALGVMPMGTFNNFAGDIGVSQDLKFAAQTIARADTIDIDTAKINDRIFINNTTIGLFAHIISLEKKAKLKMGIGKVLNLLLSGFKVFRFFPLYHIHIKTDGCETKEVTPFVFVGNNRFELALLDIGMRKRLDEGFLSLYYAKCKKRWCIIRLVFESIFNKLDQSEDFMVRQVDKLELRSRKKRLKFMIDGEILKLRTPVKIEIIPKSLKIIK